MPVPTYDRFIEPVLRFLALHPAGVAAKDAHVAAADALGVSVQDRDELLPSWSQLVYKNRAGWAHNRLKRAGLSSSPRRGTWQITQEGLNFIADHPQPFSVQLSTEKQQFRVQMIASVKPSENSGSRPNLI
jgi:restriction system protein